MVLKKDQTNKPEENQEEQRKESREISVGNANGVDKEQVEFDEDEEFNPDSATRDALLTKYKDLEEQLNDAEERLLRTAADAENFKKRLQREKEEQTRYANESFIRELLPVIDNLERALDHSQAESNQGSLLEGLNMTLKGFVDTLARFGCTAVEAVGQPFDPNYHEAVSQEETADYDSNIVVRELQKGYTLKDRLLRPAMVVVSKPSGPMSGTAERKQSAGEDKAEKSEVKIKVKKA